MCTHAHTHTHARTHTHTHTHIHTHTHTHTLTHTHTHTHTQSLTLIPEQRSQAGSTCRHEPHVPHLDRAAEPQARSPSWFWQGKNNNTSDHKINTIFDSNPNTLTGTSASQYFLSSLSLSSVTKVSRKLCILNTLWCWLLLLFLFTVGNSCSEE